MRRQQLGEDHPRIAISLKTLAEIHLARDNPAAAEPLLRRALDSFRRTYGDRHLRTAGAKSLLGESLARIGLAEEGVPLLEDAYVTARELLGEESDAATKALERWRRFR